MSAGSARPPDPARFDAGWLALREPFDHATRAGVALPPGVAVEVAGRAPVVRVVDLGSGTGSNLRHLAPRLGARQHWRLVDHDAALLALVPQRLADWAASRGWTSDRHDDGVRLAGDGRVVEVVTQAADLSADPAAIALHGVSLVTTSALLDLVSATWLERLVAHCVDHGCSVHWALSYDGRVVWSPADPDDAWVTTLLNRHQETDKGFGAALGPRAADCAQRLLAAAGRTVHAAPVDWRIGSDTAGLAMQAALIDGWCDAACEVAPDEAPRVTAWAARRRARAAASTLTVGHRDLVA